MPKVLDKIRCYDFEGNFLQDFNSTSEAALELNLSITSISNVTTGRSLHANGFQFRTLSTNIIPERIASLEGVYNSGRKRNQ